MSDVPTTKKPDPWAWKPEYTNTALRHKAQELMADLMAFVRENGCDKTAQNNCINGCEMIVDAVKRAEITVAQHKIHNRMKAEEDSK